MNNLKKYYKSFILLSYSGIIFFYYFSGIIKKLVHPRMHVFVLITALIILLFALLEFFINKNDEVRKSNIIYLLPLLLIFFINGANLSNSIIKNKGVDIGKNQPSQNTNTKIDDTVDKIIISEDKYYNNTLDLIYNIDKNVGKTVVIHGFIHRDNSTLENQFIIGRMAMVCCAADAYLIGLLAEYNDYKSIKTNEWYEMTGIISKTEQSNFHIALLTITDVKKIDKPKDEYVY
jgi:putative membrane protein